jgi:TonB family protein
MRMRYALILLLLLSSFSGLANRAQGQQASSDSVRRILRQTAPAYPELAKKMSLGGTVKVVALVMASGDVKSVEPVGGSPVLIKAAEEAVAKWKFAPGGESKEIIELHFTPN